MVFCRFVLVVAIVATVAGISFAQQPVGYPDSVYVSPSGRRRTPTEIEAMKRIVDSQRTNARFEEMDAIRNQMADGLPPTPREPRPTKSGKAVLSAAEYLLPSKVRSRYEDFLKVPGTGIFRLLNGLPCDVQTDRSKSSEENCPANIVPGRGMFFSFRQRDYADYALADLGVKDGVIFSLGSLNTAMFVSLGASPIQDLAVATPGMKFLLDFLPAPSVEGAAAQSGRFEKGVRDREFLYSNVVKLKLDTTYALRVVAYRPFYKVPGRDQNDKSEVLKKVYPLGNDFRRDIVVGFRVVEKHANGDLIVLWKEIRNVESPEFELPRPPAAK